MKRYIVEAIIIVCAAVAITVALTACSENDKYARQDLAADAQSYDVSEARIVVNPDGFPNISHKCMDATGFWTTTDRTVIIVYNDWLCPGATREKDMVVINGVPRAIVNSGG